MTTFLVKSQLKHDGDIYPIDSSIELDDKETIKQLLGDGVIARIPASPAKTGKEPANLGAAKKPDAKTGDDAKKDDKSDADNL